jgi:hypothetical protein
MADFLQEGNSTNDGDANSKIGIVTQLFSRDSNISTAKKAQVDKDPIQLEVSKQYRRGDQITRSDAISFPSFG